MSSSGRSLSQWRRFMQHYRLDSYSSISIESIQKDITRILSKSSDSKVEKKNDSITNQSSKSVAIKEPSTKYNEMRKALQSLNDYIPQMTVSGSQNTPDKNDSLPKWMIKKKEVTSKSSIDARTRHLIRGLDTTLPDSTKLRRVDDLCTHLKTYPFSRGAATKCSGVNRLLRLLHYTTDPNLEESIREALALIGYVAPVRGQGIRILSIDGGGTRGLAALEMLEHLEVKTGKPIHELFDLICGVSTGAIIAVLIGAHRMPLSDCKELYRDLSLKVFSQTTFKGTTNLVWKNSFYDSDAWTNILKENMGDTPMIDTSRDEDSTKLCLVSTQANANWIKPFLFRNYNFPTRVASHFNGSSSNLMWEGVRASAAAPAYFSEFRIEDLVLLDGGVLMNNPTSIGIHEARQLWPNAPLQTVLSVGTGRHEPLALYSNKPVNWAMRLRSIVNSATDTEGVHTTLHDLLPGDVYFRLNPYLSEDIALDEIREDKLAIMIEDSNLYLRKNEIKINGAVDSLVKPKSTFNSILDSVQLRRQMWDI